MHCLVFFLQINVILISAIFTYLQICGWRHPLFSLFPVCAISRHQTACFASRYGLFQPDKRHILQLSEWQWVKGEAPCRCIKHQKSHRRCAHADCKIWHGLFADMHQRYRQTYVRQPAGIAQKSLTACSKIAKNWKSIPPIHIAQSYRLYSLCIRTTSLIIQNQNHHDVIKIKIPAFHSQRKGRNAVLHPNPPQGNENNIYRVSYQAKWMERLFVCR